MSVETLSIGEVFGGTEDYGEDNFRFKLLTETLIGFTAEK